MVEKDPAPTGQSHFSKRRFFPFSELQYYADPCQNELVRAVARSIQVLQQKGCAVGVTDHIHHLSVLFQVFDGPVDHFHTGVEFFPGPSFGYRWLRGKN